jgi:hypothetical protein
MLSKPPERRPEIGETARYIAGISKELRTMAAGADLGFLSYLLAMVEEEAGATARRASAEKSATEV